MLTQPREPSKPSKIDSLVRWEQPTPTSQSNCGTSLPPKSKTPSIYFDPHACILTSWTTRHSKAPTIGINTQWLLLAHKQSSMKIPICAHPGHRTVLTLGSSALPRTTTVAIFIMSPRPMDTESPNLANLFPQHCIAPSYLHKTHIIELSTVLQDSLKNVPDATGHFRSYVPWCSTLTLSSAVPLSNLPPCFHTSNRRRNKG